MIRSICIFPSCSALWREPFVTWPHDHQAQPGSLPVLLARWSSACCVSFCVSFANATTTKKHLPCFEYKRLASFAMWHHRYVAWQTTLHRALKQPDVQMTSKWRANYMDKHGQSYTISDSNWVGSIGSGQLNILIRPVINLINFGPCNRTWWCVAVCDEKLNCPSWLIMSSEFEHFQ